jgi:hypothetical protein
MPVNYIDERTNERMDQLSRALEALERKRVRVLRVKLTKRDVLAIFGRLPSSCEACYYRGIPVRIVEA